MIETHGGDQAKRVSRGCSRAWRRAAVGCSLGRCGFSTWLEGQQPRLAVPLELRPLA
jgi:hypothetical protein